MTPEKHAEIKEEIIRLASELIAQAHIGNKPGSFTILFDDSAVFVRIVVSTKAEMERRASEIIPN